jgi:chromosome segregation protein
MRTMAESALATAERRLADAARAAAGRAERLARLRGMVDAAASRAAATSEEIDRLTTAAEAARARAERARQEYSQVQDVADDGDSDRSGIAVELEQAQRQHQQHSERVVAARKSERAANSEVAALHARTDALSETLRQGVDATAAVLADPERFRGILGTVAAQLTVADGYQKAIAAALGGAAEALTVNSLDAAVEVLTGLRAANAGTVGLVIAGSPGDASDAGNPPHSPGRAAGASAGGAGSASPARPALPGNARWAADLVTGSAEVSGAIAELLGDVAVFGGLTEAAAFVLEHPDFRAVTRDGDLIGARWARGGSAGGQSLLDVRAAADEAAGNLAAAELASDAAADALAAASEAQEAARQQLEEIRGRMRAVDAAAAEISGRLGRLAGAARAAVDEAKRLDASVGAALRSAEKDQVKHQQLKNELAEADAEELRASDPEFEDQQADEEREELTQRAATARNAEMEARLEVRTVEERLRAISGRADSLAASATAERAARDRAAIRRRQRAAQASVARAVAAGAAFAVSAAEASLAQAAEQRSEAEAASASGTEALKAVRAQAATVSGELDKVVNTAHGTEISRNEHRLRLEQLASHAADEYGTEPGVLVTEYGPDKLILAPADAPFAAAAVKRGTAVPADTVPAETVPADTVPADPVPADPVPAAPHPDGAGPDGAGVVAGSDGLSLADALRAVRTEAEQSAGDHAAEAQQRKDRRQGKEPAGPATVAVPYVRADQEARAAEAERQMVRLGKVNPLALEEYAALQERHQFLATQLDDLRKTRRDLLTVVKEVDDRVQEVFASAYADTAREFEGLFAGLFPGGSGRLILTEPDDMLTTGIEIEARPPGKKVKRLSLLSGGERSLTAIAYLFAIFKARPSPFYVLDEVEAALDDTNLQRLLGVFGELRENSQLIVITHQRRTMEAADALYGVSMRGDGVSQVISQRIREAELA